MASTGEASGPLRVSLADLAAAFLVLLFLGLFARMLYVSLPDLSRHSDEKLWAYWLHIGGGSLVLALGPFQFIAPLRNRFRRFHRAAGYAFVAGSLAAFAGFWAAQPIAPDLSFASQATAITLWMAAMAAAVVAARRGHFLTHRHNMTRAFVLAANFVVVRLMHKSGMAALGSWFSASEDAQLAHADWLVWVVPIVAVEIYYGIKWDRMLRRREASGQPFA